MRQVFSDMLRSIGSLGVGFKLAVIISGYIGAGSFAKWVLDIWYPATREIWSRVGFAMNWPELSNLEKDTLTALVFFLPFGMNAGLKVFGGQTIADSDAGLSGRFIATLLGLIFFYLVCSDILVELVG